MTCEKNNHGKTMTNWKNFFKNLLTKWVGSKKKITLLGIDVDSKPLYAIALSIVLLALSNFYAANKGVSIANDVDFNYCYKEEVKP